MFKIMGRYKGGRQEEIDSFDSREEADRMLGEYRMAFGTTYMLWVE